MTRPLKRSIHRALHALGLACLSACSTPGSTTTPVPLEGTTWRLLSLPGQTAPAAGLPTLRFETGRAFGSDGCNRYTGAYTAAGAELRLGAPRAGTLMACPDELAQRAAAYGRALAETARYRVLGTGAAARLELLAADGRIVATFASQPQTLAGTRWEVTAIHNGRQAVVSVERGTRVTLAFDTEGRATGSAGCNRFTARFENGAEGLRVEAPAVTRMACPEPGVMVQEQAFLRALQAARKVRVEGESLELRDGEGALQISARAEAAAR